MFGIEESKEEAEDANPVETTKGTFATVVETEFKFN